MYLSSVLCSYAVGFMLWNVDNNLCPDLRLGRVIYTYLNQDIKTLVYCISFLPDKFTCGSMCGITEATEKPYRVPLVP